MKNRIFVSLLCFIPTTIGIPLWNFLPDNLAIHFGPIGADGFASKFIVIFIIPLMFFLLDIVYTCIAHKYPNWLGKNNYEKLNSIFPFISLLVFLFSIINSI